MPLGRFTSRRRTLAILWLAAFAVVMVVAGGLYRREAGLRAAPPSLVLADVTRGAVIVTVDATGTLQTVDTVEVGTQVSGSIASLGVDFNDTVKKGQVVATLDQAIFLSQIQQAEAQVIRLRAEHERARVSLLDAETKLKRAKQLGDRQLLALSEVEAAEVAVELAKASLNAAQAQLTQAEGALAQAKVNLSYTVIRSPVDGIVLKRNVDVGQTVSAGLQAPTLFVIARSLDRLELAASVAESDVGRVRDGQPVSFTVDAYPQQTFTGVVRQVRLQPTVQQNVVSYTTIIDVPNTGGLLKPGMTATLAIEVARADDVLRVPAAALRFTPPEDVLRAYASEPAESDTGSAGHSATIWQLSDGMLRPVRVTVGLTDGTTVAIVDGPLVDGAKVVTKVATSAPTGSSSTSGSPLVPAMPRRPGAARR